MTLAPSHSAMELQYLDDRWDDKAAANMDEPELLRYRSNLLGSDLRITNFGGGNTSSKVVTKDPLTGEDVRVLWVKGSGGDLGSIKRAGFATLYLERFLTLEGDLSRRGPRGRDGGVLPTLHLRHQSALQLPSTRRCTVSFLTGMSIIFTRIVPSRWPPPPTGARRWKSSTAPTVISSSGCRGSGPGSSLR